MRKLFSILLPIAAGVALIFFALPIYGGNLDIFVQKMAIDWEMPVLAVRIILAVAAAIMMTVLFQLLKKIALWLAILSLFLLLFAPALLSDVPIVAEEVKTSIEQKLNL
ncbi:hypothetical protein IJF86_00315 [Candidatus Saccharibacteria bacterium]|nr:hypothetical protein [Candidatus Saccharibacteria bacterium]